MAWRKDIRQGLPQRKKKRLHEKKGRQKIHDFGAGRVNNNACILSSRLGCRNTATHDTYFVYAYAKPCHTPTRRLTPPLLLALLQPLPLSSPSPSLPPPRRSLEGEMLMLGLLEALAIIPLHPSVFSSSSISSSLSSPSPPGRFFVPPLRRCRRLRLLRRRRLELSLRLPLLSLLAGDRDRLRFNRCRPRESTLLACRGQTQSQAKEVRHKTCRQRR